MQSQIGKIYWIGKRLMHSVRSSSLSERAHITFNKVLSMNKSKTYSQIQYSFINQHKKQSSMFGFSRNWICSQCKSEISQSVYPCPNCPNRDEPHPQPNKKAENICLVCTFENPEFMTHCQVCDEPLSDNKSYHEKKEIRACPVCKGENNATNIVCVFCDEQMFESEKKACPICGLAIKQHLYERHEVDCMLSHEALESEKQDQLKKQREQEEISIKILKDNLEECIHCREKFYPEEISLHIEQCRKSAMNALVFDPKTRLTKLQQQAMRHMVLKSQKQHNQIKSTLQARIKKLGYTIEDLNNLQFYVQNYAPIIIHIHISKHMEFFIKDTHYRSQFQTNKSSGSLSRPSRIQWEDRMFDKMYSKAKDFERVKYGVINFTNDPKGVGACLAYGQSYFLLKQHVRQRCTFTDKDSSSADAAIATFKYCFKIINKMTDQQLKAAIDASKAKEVPSTCTTAYKQMQVHGPIEFTHDIQRIYVNRNELKTNKKLLDLVYQFSKKNKVDYDFF